MKTSELDQYDIKKRMEELQQQEGRVPAAASGATMVGAEKYQSGSVELISWGEVPLQQVGIILQQSNLGRYSFRWGFRCKPCTPSNCSCFNSPLLWARQQP